MGATAIFHCPKCGYDTPENLYEYYLDFFLVVTFKYLNSSDTQN